MYVLLNIFCILTNFMNTHLRLKFAGLKRETFVYAERGNVKLKLDVYRPRADRAPAPAIVYAHGGGWRVGWRRLIEPAFFEQVNRGYALVSFTYTFTNKAPWPAQLHDMKAAIRWTRANAVLLGIDPDKIVAGGASAGGHMACAAGLTGTGVLEGDIGKTGASSKVCGVLAFYPPTDLSLMLAQGRVARRGASELIGRDKVNDREALQSVSPVFHARGDAPSLFLVHGTEDRVVPHEHSERLVEAIRSAGGDIELLSLTNRVHADPRLNAREHRPQIDAFLDRVTGRLDECVIDASTTRHEQSHQRAERP